MRERRSEVERSRTVARAVSSPAARTPEAPKAPAARLRQRFGNRGMVALAALHVTHPKDASEQEATAVAARVARGTEPVSPGQKAAASISRTPVGNSGVAPEPGTASRIAARRGQGAPLPKETRNFMEPRFGVGFGAVKVHTDRTAADLAGRLGAKAFTIGSDVFFGAGAFQPDTVSGRELIAHELTHTVQQGANGPAAASSGDAESRTRSSTGATPGQARAPSSTAVTPSSSPRQANNQTVQRAEGDYFDFDIDIDIDVDLGIADAAHELAIAGVQRIAPSLVPLIREGASGFRTWVEDTAARAFEKASEWALAPIRTVSGYAEKLNKRFEPAIAAFQAAAGQIAANDCSPIRDAAAKIEDTATEFITPVVAYVQPVVAKVHAAVDWIGDTFVTPVWDWIKDRVADEWAKVTTIVDQIVSVWNWIRDTGGSALSAAWDWIKDQLGIVLTETSREGFLGWVREKLEAGWATIKERLAPFQKQLSNIAKVIAANALLLSPVGPILAAGAAIWGAVKAVRWISANWGKENVFVTMRRQLREVILPSMISAAGTLIAQITSIAMTLSGALISISTSLANLAKSMGSGLLSAVATVVTWVKDQVQALANWASTKLMQAMGWANGALLQLVDLMEAVVRFLGRVADVVIDIYGLPVLLAEAIWNRVPACVRDPIIDFLGPIILRQVELFAHLAADKEAWQQTKTEVWRLISMVFHDHNLVGAIKAAFRFVLRIFQMPQELLVMLLAKAESAWDVVSQAPLEFIKNAAKGLLAGFGIMWDDAFNYIKDGLTGWLLGEIEDQAISIPDNWTDPRQIFDFALSVLGISVDHVFELLEQRFDPARVRQIRSVMRRVTGVLNWVDEAIDVTKTPAENAAGMIEQARDFAGDVLSGIVQWIIGAVATEAALIAAKAAASAGLSAFLEAFDRIYRAMVTAQRWMARILGMISEALDNTLEIAAGNIEVLGQRFAALMRRGMPAVIGLLADQVGLGDIGEGIRGAIESIRTRVDQAILWFIDRIKAALEAIIASARTVGAAIAGWLGITEEFTAEDGSEHELFFEPSGDNANMMVASTRPRRVKRVLRAGGELEEEVSSSPRKLAALGQARAALVDAEEQQQILAADPQNLDAEKALKAAMNRLGQALVKTGIGVAIENVEPNVFYNASAGLAGTATADKLNNKKKKSGTPPKEDPTGWDHVKKIDPTSNFWVRAHLVSEAFGGLGIKQNLVPTDKNVNSWMSTGPEQAVKNMLAANQRAVMHYEVEVGGWHNLRTPRTRVPISGFPSSLKFRIFTMKKVNDTWVRDVDLRYPQTRTVPPPPVDSSLTLNNVSQAALKSLGFRESFAKRVAHGRQTAPYPNWREVEAHIRNVYGDLEWTDLDKLEDEIDKLKGMVRTNSPRLPFKD